jgi:hypothetical protein
MTNWYYYNTKNEKIAVTGEQLKQLTQQGVITPETVIENENGNKAQAGEVKGLMFSETIIIPNTTYHAPAQKSFSLPDIATIMNWWTMIALTALCIIGVFVVIGGWTMRSVPTTKVEVPPPVEALLQAQAPMPVAIRKPESEQKPEQALAPRSQHPDISEASIHGSVDDVRYFLERGEPVSQRDHNANTPLHLAIWWNRNSDVFKYLVSQGADINAVNRWGWTPLQDTVVSHGNRRSAEDVRFLIEHGADVNARGLDGQTPLDRAVTEEMRNILRAAGGKLAAELE